MFENNETLNEIKEELNEAKEALKETEEQREGVGAQTVAEGAACENEVFEGDTVDENGEPVNDRVPSEVEMKAKEIVDNLKEMVKRGNITRIRIRKDKNVILNIPMTAGVLGFALGAAVAPWTLIVLTITTIGLSCAVEVEDKDGNVSVIYGKEEN